MENKILLCYCKTTLCE